jgi:8-oxo-dGTP diphosphatase
VTTSRDDAEFLANYQPGDYPPVALTVDLVVLTIRDGAAQLLTVRRAAPPFAGMWALPGGFVGEHETLDDAALRELREETGVDLSAGHLEQLGTYADPGRDPRMRVASVAYLALVPDLPDAVAGSDAADARYWPLTDIVDTGGFAFDHARIIADGIERARAKLEYSTLATTFLRDEFTLGELRRVYEAFWNTTMHPSNFARKVLSSDGFVVDTGALSDPSVVKGRPARLYRAGPAAMIHPPLLRGDQR